jgi:hypothetical protein
MIMRISIFVLSLVLLTVLPSFAGPGHSHDHENSRNPSHGAKVKLDDKALIDAASKGVASLIQQKQEVGGETLDGAWGDISETAKSISKKGNGYSLIKFKDRNSKRELFILLSDAGEIYDLNFTGQFIGLKD